MATPLPDTCRSGRFANSTAANSWCVGFYCVCFYNDHTTVTHPISLCGRSLERNSWRARPGCWDDIYFNGVKPLSPLIRNASFRSCVLADGLGFSTPTTHKLTPSCNFVVIVTLPAFRRDLTKIVLVLRLQSLEKKTGFFRYEE